MYRKSLIDAGKSSLYYEYTRKGSITQPCFLSMLTSRRKGIVPDFNEALIVRSNSTVEDVCDTIHRSLKESFKYALIWGASAKHVPQRVGLGHYVRDEDVISVIGTKSGLAAK